jgi:hypothetical protein
MGKSGSDAVEDTLEIYVDHSLPIGDLAALQR